jgi:hypothetical protein
MHSNMKINVATIHELFTASYKNAGSIILYALTAHQTITSKIVQWKTMKCLKIFTTPTSVTPAVYIPS